MRRWKGMGRFDQVRVAFIILMQVAFVGAFFFALYERAWLIAFLSLVALAVAWLPSFLERNFRMRVPLEFELLLNIFIYSSIFLGEMQGFYTRFWWWDAVLHTGAGLVLGFLGFIILFSLYRSQKLDMRPALLCFFAFCFALALGALWEIFEFSMDSIFGFNMQKNGLTDTMWDMIVNTIGALVVAVSGYLYIKYKWRGIGIFEYHLDAFFARKR